MGFRYVDLDEAIKDDGLRMVVVGNVPSPWGEAAKGLFHIKGIDWLAVRLDYQNPALKEWAGQRSGPVAIYGDEQPRSGWEEILLLAERLAPSPSLLPENPDERAVVLDLAGEICGEGGLGWSRRLNLIHAGLTNDAGFPKEVATYLARKYRYTEEDGAVAGARVISLLQMLAERLHAQKQSGNAYYLGEQMMAADIYSATFMALFDPLPPELCNMAGRTRQSFTSTTPEIEAALDPILIEHRDMMYGKHLELPLSL